MNVGVVTYTGIDGLFHAWWDRPKLGAPLCKADTFPTPNQSGANLAQACQDCFEEVRLWASS